MPFKLWGRKPARAPQTPEYLQLELFEYARKVFLEDEELSREIFLVERGQAVPLDLRPRQMPWEKPPIDTPEHQRAWFRGAARAAKHSHAEAVIAHTEAWKASELEIEPGQRVSDSPHRREILTSALLTRDGQAQLLIAEILRAEDGAVSLGETCAEPGSTFWQLEPFYALWGLTLPDNSMRLGDTLVGEGS